MGPFTGDGEVRIYHRRGLEVGGGGVFRWGDNDGNSRNAYSFVVEPNLSGNRGEKERAEQIRTGGEQTRLGAEKKGEMFGIPNLFATRRDVVGWSSAINLCAPGRRCVLQITLLLQPSAQPPALRRSTAAKCVSPHQ